MEENNNIPQPNGVPQNIQTPKDVVDKNDVLPEANNIKTQETYTLPSKGLLYDPKDNIPSAITLRRMTTKEDKMRMRNESKSEIRRDILQACILNDIDAGKLKLMDANYLLFRLRALSLVNDEYKVGCICPFCNTEFVHKLNLLEVPVEYWSEDKLKNLSVHLPVCNANVTLKYPDLNNSIRMNKDMRDYMERFPDSDVSELLYISANVLYIDTINGNKPMLEELEDWMENLDILDSRALINVIETLDTQYGFVESIKTACPKCSKEVKHGLPITSELFTPSK